jgi:D-sedoheptulose 7-phosphate isomerase
MLRRSAGLKLALATDAAPVLAVEGLCERATRGGIKLKSCGNAAAAADAHHLSTELVIRLRGAAPRESWPATT